LELAGIV